MTGRDYTQPRTGARCGCKPGVARDNCPTCEGTGWVLDFVAIRRGTAGGADRLMPPGLHSDDYTKAFRAGYVAGFNEGARWGRVR